MRTVSEGESGELRNIAESAFPLTYAPCNKLYRLGLNGAPMLCAFPEGHGGDCSPVQFRKFHEEIGQRLYLADQALINEGLPGSWDLLRRQQPVNQDNPDVKMPEGFRPITVGDIEDMIGF